jgi:hypothetical protein
VSVNVALYPAKKGEVLKLSEIKHPPIATVKNLLLAPDGEYLYSYWSDSPFTDEHQATIDSPEHQVVIFGYIAYLDIFDCPHWTTFCYYFISERGGVWATCEQHNDADNDRCGN